ncbi:MAG: MFS transporter [Acidilobaceae archaeon]
MGACLPVRGRPYEVFNVEIVMLTVLSSLYMLSTMLWYNFLSLYLGSFFEVEEVGLLLSILTAGGMLSIILGGLLADSLGRRPAIAIAIIGVAVAAVALGFSRSFMVLALAILVLGLCFQSLRTITRVLLPRSFPRR